MTSVQNGLGAAPVFATTSIVSGGQSADTLGVSLTGIVLENLTTAQSLSVLYITEGNAASTIEFAGPAADPAPSDLVIEMGQKQDALIKSQLGA